MSMNVFYYVDGNFETFSSTVNRIIEKVNGKKRCIKHVWYNVKFTIYPVVNKWLKVMVIIGNMPSAGDDANL